SIAKLRAIAGCGPSRISQCNQLISTINKGSTLVNAQKDRYDATSSRHLALQLKTVAYEIQILELENKKLEDYQNQFSQFFRELSQAFSEIALALEAGHRVETNREGRQKLEEAQNQLAIAGQKANQTAEEEDTLIEELQNYCQGTSQF
ncbi:MAG: hypothetical protein F6K35_49280, partial [Okeania sp. SIO2H7]|nr:hypothetical protein [Okeania sp. SIO2H7]